MPTIEERALALMNEVRAERSHPPAHSGFIDRDTGSISEAFCRLLEALDAERTAHAQFRQEVSDDLRQYFGFKINDVAQGFLGRFIIPKPDPLVEAVKDCGYATLDAIEPEFAAELRAALAKRGLKLVEVGDAD